jgi:hypothetical protein
MALILSKTEFMGRLETVHKEFQTHRDIKVFLERESRHHHH